MKNLLLPSWGKRVSLALLAVPLADVFLPSTLGNVSIASLATGLAIRLFSAETDEDERTTWCRFRALKSAALLFIMWVTAWGTAVWLDVAKAVPSVFCVVPMVLGAYLVRYYYELRFKPSRQI